MTPSIKLCYKKTLSTRKTFRRVRKKDKVFPQLTVPNIPMSGHYRKKVIFVESYSKLAKRDSETTEHLITDPDYTEKTPNKGL